MRILIDTNIVLDVILKRYPFYDDSVEVFGLAKKDMIEEYISASAVTDIYYLLCRQLKNKKQAKRLLRELFKIVSIAGVTEREIQNAMELDWSDFEDAVQYSVALLQTMDGIVTRNLDDYEGSEIPVWMPGQALEMIKCQKGEKSSLGDI